MPHNLLTVASVREGEPRRFSDCGSRAVGLDAMDENVTALGSILDGCLNWQELCAGSVCDDTHLSWKGRRHAKSTYALASQKRAFLLDVLECSLNDPTCGELRHRVPGWRALELIVRTEEGFRLATAFAKVFRAAMSARILSWNPAGRFRYTASRHRHPVFYPASTRYNPLQPAATVTLARSLKRLAVAFASLAPDINRNDTPTPEDRAGMLAAAKCQYCGQCDHLFKVLDRIWPRATECAYSRHCLEYDEYYYLHIDLLKADDPISKIRDAAAAKLQFLHNTETETRRAERCAAIKRQWRAVARNWLCRGFRRCIYCWDKESCDIYDSQEQVHARAEVKKIVDYIDDKDTAIYDKIRKEAGFWAMLDDAPAAVRMATAGNDLNDILQELPSWGDGRESVYALLYVASTAKEGPKLQECWDNIAANTEGDVEKKIGDGRDPTPHPPPGGVHPERDARGAGDGAQGDGRWEACKWP